MIQFILVFAVVAAATHFYDARRGKQGTAAFREMTPQQLKDLYANGGSLKVISPLGRIMRPIVMGLSAAIIASIIF